MNELPLPPVLPPAAAPLRLDNDCTFRVGDSGLTLDVFIGAYHAGSTPEEIAGNFDTITPAQAYMAIGYYLANRVRFDEYLDQRRQFAAKLRQECEQRYGRGPGREELLARQGAMTVS